MLTPATMALEKYGRNLGSCNVAVDDYFVKGVYIFVTWTPLKSKCFLHYVLIVVTGLRILIKTP